MSPDSYVMLMINDYTVINQRGSFKAELKLHTVSLFKLLVVKLHNFFSQYL